MGFDRPGRAVMNILYRLLLLTQVVLIAQAHPYGNHSALHIAEEGDSHSVVARASDSEFTALPNSPRIRVHSSCLSRWNLNQWDATINQLKAVANYGKEATELVVQILNNNLNNDNPTLDAQQRRMLDLFMVLYGSFMWNDVAAKTRVRDRAVRVNKMAALFAGGLVGDTVTANWNFFCDESEWVLDPNAPAKTPFWMIKDLPAGPRKQKVSDSLCTIPENYAAGFGGGQAEAVTLTAKHTQGNPNWITFCNGVWAVLQYQTHIWYQPNNQAAVLSNGDFLENMIFNTPERLLAHEFTHGQGQFGNYYAKDIKYGWVDMVQLAIDDNAQTDATKSKPVNNADTFSYWINGVFFNFCNFRSGRCEDVNTAAQRP